MADMRQRPYVTARTAAALLGVPLECVVEDIDRGRDGALGSFIGDEQAGIWVLYANQLESADLVAYHRARLQADGDSAVVGEP